jgi:DNA-binding PadR family transcriptional regulator
MARRKVSNPLALAVLALLNERPMHPYEISTTLRERHKEESIKLNYGSLYTVVDTLVRAGYITAIGTVRQGRRPERTTYEITEAGRVELHDWLSELVSTPVKEYAQFEAALSLLAVLPPGDALRLLTERRARLTLQVSAARSLQAAAAREGLPRLFHLEGEYVNRLREAELRYVEELIECIRQRTLDGLELWEAFHLDDPAEMAARVAAMKTPGKPLAERWLETVKEYGTARGNDQPSGAGPSADQLGTTGQRSIGGGSGMAADDPDQGRRRP